MKRDVRLYLQDICESIDAIVSYTKDLSFGDFQENMQVQDAVIRRLEVIGEAAKSIDGKTRKKYGDVPWKEIAGMRDILAHAYFGVKIKRVWEVVDKDLPELKETLEKK